MPYPYQGSGGRREFTKPKIQSEDVCLSSGIVDNDITLGCPVPAKEHRGPLVHESCQGTSTRGPQGPKAGFAYLPYSPCPRGRGVQQYMRPKQNVS